MTNIGNARKYNEPEKANAFIKASFYFSAICLIFYLVLAIPQIKPANRANLKMQSNTP